MYLWHRLQLETFQSSMFVSAQELILHCFDWRTAVTGDNQRYSFSMCSSEPWVLRSHSSFLLRSVAHKKSACCTSPPGQRWPVWKLTLLHCCPVRRAAESKRSSSQSKVAAAIRRRPLVRHCDIACWMTIIQASCVDRPGAPECQPAYDFYSRCFVPWAGVTEDPVTGKNFRYYGHQEIISEWFLTA